MMIDTVKISIIIPVYNCEKYIEQCIKSVLFQTLKEIEIICVDDGSSDLSVQIISALVFEEKRILLLQQENQGAGPARNLALKKAKGKYIAFLDADDYYWDKDALLKMYNVCETRKVSACLSSKWCANGKFVDTEPLLQDNAESEVFEYLNYQMDYAFTCYLFSRKLIIENKLEFPHYQRFEDPPFLVKALYHAGRIGKADTCLYYYRMPVASERFSERKTVDLLLGLIENLQFALKYNLNILFKNTLHRLEYEYADIIYHNISPNSLVMLELLVQINHIVGEKMGTQDYVIRPLRLILFHREAYEDFLIWKIKQKKKIAIYGAGKLGHAFLLFLEDKNLIDRVGHIVVSEYGGNESVIWGIPVISLKDFQKEHEDFIFVTVGEMYQEEIKGLLEQKEYKDYYIVREEFLHMLAENL